MFSLTFIPVVSADWLIARNSSGPTWLRIIKWTNANKRKKNNNCSWIFLLSNKKTIKQYRTDLFLVNKFKVRLLLLLAQSINTSFSKGSLALFSPSESYSSFQCPHVSVKIADKWKYDGRRRLTSLFGWVVRATQIVKYETGGFLQQTFAVFLSVRFVPPCSVLLWQNFGTIVYSKYFIELLFQWIFTEKFLFWNFNLFPYIFNTLIICFLLTEHESLGFWKQIKEMIIQCLFSIKLDYQLF